MTAGLALLVMTAALLAFAAAPAGATPNATLTGTITDATSGIGITGAVIDLYQSGSGTNGVGNAAPTPFQTLTTGTGGAYSASVTPGTYYVEALGATLAAHTGALFAGGISDWRGHTRRRWTTGTSDRGRPFNTLGDVRRQHDDRVQ